MNPYRIYMRGWARAWKTFRLASGPMAEILCSTALRNAIAWRELSQGRQP